jgi:glycosyltransferase involved in cell wall biosynthesis
VIAVTAIVTCMSDAERPFVLESLRSVQHQSVQAKVILCVADRNEWIDQLLESVDPKPELMRLPLAFAAAIRNQAIAAVDTEFVAFLDSDDAWLPSKLSRQLTALTSRALDVIAAKHILIREDGAPFFFGFAKSLPMTSSWLGRTAVFRDHPFDLVPVGEDVLLWERLASEGHCDIMDDFLIRYRVREVSLSSKTATKERKLAYAHRSEIAGMRPLMLGTSYAANLGLRLRAAVRAVI